MSGDPTDVRSTEAARAEYERAASSAGGPGGVQTPPQAGSEEAEAPTVDVDGPVEPEHHGAAPEDPLARAERQRDEYLDHLRRERAEFENFRRRSTKERMEALDRGAQQLVANMLHVLDTFGFALQSANERDGDPLAKGVSMVHDELMGVLRTAGLEEVPGVGAPFDPIHHDAVMSVDAEEPTDDPVVVEVLRPGYRFKGRVLRPASVKVAK